MRLAACGVAVVAAMAPVMAFADSAPPRPALPGVLGLWQFDPLFVAGIVVAAGLYTAGVVRVNRLHPDTPVPRRRIVCFSLGLLALVVAVLSPLAAYDDSLLEVHMWQHLVLMEVAPPLLLFGAPITLLLRASTPHFRKAYVLPLLHSRVVRVLTFPVVTWLVFAVTIAITHDGPIYQAALVNQNLHASMHVLYLVAGLLFYWPALAVDPGASQMSHPVRLVYMLTQMATMAIAGAAFWSSDHVLYHYYLTHMPAWGPGALADQHAAGVIMWVGGGGIDMAWMPYVAYRWVKHEELVEQRMDRELARRRQPAPEPPV